jgi:NitT/TauT family transport system ATP-binding protein
MTTAIAFTDVSKSFAGSTALFERLSFTVARGEFVCLLGPSGCGKSTVLRLIGGLADFDRGSIAINGESPAVAWPRLSYVFQSPRLTPWRNAADNVVLGMQLRNGGGRTRERMDRALELLDLVGLSREASKFPRMLSGGERQRVAIARALAVDPDIILMDEPFSALDPNTRARLRTEITAIWQKTGKTIVFVTHDVEEALELADRILMFVRKPTSVLRELPLRSPRPRNVAADHALQAAKRELLEAYKAAGASLDGEVALAS